MPVMKLKKLKTILDGFDTFDSPSIALEQYPTFPDTAANLLHVACNAGDIENKIVADLGCGCGTLSIGAALLDAGFCVGFEIDPSALHIALSNQDYAECTNIDFVNCDVTSLKESKWHKAFDTVIMNPPFGTKGNKGIDMVFLNIAASLARHSIYSLHKSSTVTHIGKVAKALGLVMKPCYEIEFENPKRSSKLEHLEVQVADIEFEPPEDNSFEPKPQVELNDMTGEKGK